MDLAFAFLRQVDIYTFITYFISGKQPWQLPLKYEFFYILLQSHPNLICSSDGSWTHTPIPGPQFLRLMRTTYFATEPYCYIWNRCVPPVGFEPTILGLRGRSFNQLSYRGIICTRTGTRTLILGLKVRSIQPFCHTGILYPLRDSNPGSSA